MQRDSGGVFVTGLVEKDTSDRMKAGSVREQRAPVPPEPYGGSPNGEHCPGTLIGARGASPEHSNHAGHALAFHTGGKNSPSYPDAAGAL